MERIKARLHKGAFYMWLADVDLELLEIA